MHDPHEALSEAARLSILQGRFEALQQCAREVEPRHLLLGLLKTMTADELGELGLPPEACERLITDLGSSSPPAPLSPNDIEYAAECFQHIATAIESAEGKRVEPRDLFMVLKQGRDANRWP